MRGPLRLGSGALWGPSSLPVRTLSRASRAQKCLEASQAAVPECAGRVVALPPLGMRFADWTLGPYLWIGFPDGRLRDPHFGARLRPTRETTFGSFLSYDKHKPYRDSVFNLHLRSHEKPEIKVKNELKKKRKKKGRSQTFVLGACTETTCWLVSRAPLTQACFPQHRHTRPKCLGIFTG